MNYLLEALCKKFEGDIAIAKANILTYQRNSVGIGEHPNIIDEIDKQVDIVSANENKIDIIKTFRDADN